MPFVVGCYVIVAFICLESGNVARALLWPLELVRNIVVEAWNIVVGK